MEMFVARELGTRLEITAPLYANGSEEIKKYMQNKVAGVITKNNKNYEITAVQKLYCLTHLNSQ